MSERAITQRQQYWLDHIRVANKFGGTLVDYAKREGLKANDLYQWKMLLARRGFICGKIDTPKAFFAVIFHEATHLAISGVAGQN